MARTKKVPLITDFNRIPAEALVPEEECPYPIPKHWTWVRLESVVEMRIGKTPARAEEKYWKSYDYPWVKISDFTDKGVITGTEERISSVALSEVFKGRLVPSGTLLMSFKLTIGKCAILDIAAVHNEAIISIFPQSNIVNRDYLFYCLPAITQFGIQRSAVKGSTLNSKSLNALPLPLPPVVEQKEIVAYLDEKLGKIDSVREKLQDFLDHADQRKENLIQAAITGHLTQSWRELHGVAREDWIIKTVDELGAVVTGGTPSTMQPEFYGSDVPFIKPTDLNAGRHVTSSESYLSMLGSEKVRMLPPYTVAVCCIGATISKCGLIEVESATNQQINALVPNKENDSTYLYYLCASPSFKQMVINNSSSTTLPILNKRRFSKLKVTVPSLDEQEEIVRILDEQLARINDADSKVQEALDQLNLMKEQLVSAALAGRFTAVAG